MPGMADRYNVSCIAFQSSSLTRTADRCFPVIVTGAWDSFTSLISRYRFFRALVTFKVARAASHTLYRTLRTAQGQVEPGKRRRPPTTRLLLTEGNTERRVAARPRGGAGYGPRSHHAGGAPRAGSAGGPRGAGSAGALRLPDSDASDGARPVALPGRGARRSLVAYLRFTICTPADQRHHRDLYLAKVRDRIGERLSAVALYGSVARAHPSAYRKARSGCCDYGGGDRITEPTRPM